MSGEEEVQESEEIEDSKDDFELTIAFDENKGIKKFLYTMSGIVKL